ncbi:MULTISPECIES: branched-chain amino acid ABC transporter permease [Brevibacillus]|jgi:branched-chain amino acid transport system permease protein|uniref:branched-chain amino acid ABC transporter permease n=1 Tax=Brevibacillus TaxID=55080 RepID=UPI0003FD1FFE|nr:MULTISPECIES: branched-chain amino acid ABC transporter permease [Brevibacillus]UYZ14808.1 branched-chain amino acid ABC transporter permease [Brevibacillus sp. WF146]
MVTSSLLMHILNGLAYGMLLFMIAAGLSIIFGLMNVVNLAHGAFYLAGVYIAYSLVARHMGFWPSLLVSVAVVAILGVLVEKWLLERVYGRELEQVLLTFGLSFIFADLVEWIWGSSPLTLPVPEALDVSLNVGGMMFPAYRIFVILVGCLLAVLLWYIESKTRIGAIIRAGVDDREMLSALGININVVFTCMFAVGAALAGLSGVLGGPIMGMYVGIDAEILVSSLVIVVVGGLGTWKGAFIGAIVIGVVDTLGRVWFPSFTMAMVFLIMIAVLLMKPNGLFGRGAAA